jgi:hypothetical protein
MRCVLLESGSPPLSDPDADAFEQTFVIAQVQEEPAVAFAERVLERIASLERAGRHFTTFALLTGSEHEASAQRARRRLVARLAARLLATPGPTSITLRASRDAAPEARAELLDLAADVMACRNDEPAEASPQPVGVHLCFDDSSPEPHRQSGPIHAIPGKGVSAPPTPRGRRRRRR